MKGFRSMATSHAQDGNSAGTFLGHPKGLFVLFFAEMWERFSYYGMRALLILYLTKQFLFSDRDASLVYGAYTSLVYITPVIGGYLADKYLGQRKAVLFGGIMIAVGHILLGFEGDSGNKDMLNYFYAALSFIIIGTGFLKANISVIVGQLYPRDDIRRDPAYTIFYMGINLGSFLGVLICGYLGETVSWSLGFGAAAAGMLAGIIVFVLFKPLLLGRGEAPDPVWLKTRAAGVSREWWFYIGAFLSVGIAWILVQSSIVVGWMLLLTGAVVLAYILWQAIAKLDKIDGHRLYAALFLIALQPLFWALFEQAGASLSLFTDRYVDRSMFGLEIPASVFQSVNSFFIITLAPIMAWFWTVLGRRNLEPSSPAKFGMALMLAGFGYLVFNFGAGDTVASGTLMPVFFIFAIYLFHTIAELALSPVGLSAMARLTLPHMLSLMMGTWFLSTAAGNFIAGLISASTGGTEGAASAADVVSVYEKIGWIGVGVGVVVLLVSPFVKRLMHLDKLKEDALEGVQEAGEPASAGIHPTTSKS
jgi:proton-dependent oligopeptide transporter, POT family